MCLFEIHRIKMKLFTEMKTSVSGRLKTTSKQTQFDKTQLSIISSIKSSLTHNSSISNPFFASLISDRIKDGPGKSGVSTPEMLSARSSV